MLAWRGVASRRNDWYTSGSGRATWPSHRTEVRLRDGRLCTLETPVANGRLGESTPNDIARSGWRMGEAAQVAAARAPRGANFPWSSSDGEVCLSRGLDSC